MVEVRTLTAGKGSAIQVAERIDDLFKEKNFARVAAFEHSGNSDRFRVRINLDAAQCNRCERWFSSPAQRAEHRTDTQNNCTLAVA
jgi:hypothetical protein